MGDLSTPTQKEWAEFIGCGGSEYGLGKSCQPRCKPSVAAKYCNRNADAAFEPEWIGARALYFSINCISMDSWNFRVYPGILDY